MITTASAVTELVGNTPYVRYNFDDVPDANIYIKLEGYNPTGSVKDRACVHMIRQMITQGKLRKGMTLLDASSGNFASSLAYFGSVFGFRTTVVVSSKITREKQDFIRYFGADIKQVGNFTIDGNEYCRNMIEHDKEGTYCFLDQLHNWDNPAAHAEFTGPEILESFPGLVAVAGSLGSGGTMFGTGSYLRSYKPDVRVITAAAEAGTVIPGMGGFADGDYITPFITKGLDERIFTDVIKVDASWAHRRTCELKKRGIFCGPQTGGVLHSVLTFVRDNNLQGDIVVISGDAGWKNLDKLMAADVQYDN